MNGEELLNIMSDVDGRLIIEAEKKPRKKLLITIGSVAAAAALAITAGVKFIPEAAFEEPPVLILSDYNFSGMGGMGFEGIHVGDVSELENGNPWSEKMNIKALPVFKSSSAYCDGEKMKAVLLSAAEYFGLDADSLEIEDSTPSSEEIEEIRKQFTEYGASDGEINGMIKNMYSMGRVAARSEGIRIDVDSSFCVSIAFDEGIELPEGYNLGVSASEEERSRTGEYLINEYKGLLNMENPVMNLNGMYEGDIEFYDGGKDREDAVVNYSLDFAVFISQEEGKLHIIRMYTDTGYEKIADYPVISAEEAKKMLSEGNYLTSAPYDIKGDEEIGKIELMYRTGIGYEYVMPFYRILVRLPEEYDNDMGETCYGGYYVPAVKGEYLEGMPVMITFNGAPITK
ncbi:MAG: hypothetical protein NC394_03630 [Bacteroides sp.]|nr:hypothetical protein [Bacteroides sp.]